MAEPEPLSVVGGWFLDRRPVILVVRPGNTQSRLYAGTKSAKCSDKKGLAKSFHPLIQLTTRGLSNGPVTLSCAAMLTAAASAPFFVEFRGAGGTSEVGPLRRFLADGRILADVDGAFYLDEMKLSFDK